MPLKCNDPVCADCPGLGWGPRLMSAEGSGQLAVAICGEALGEHEDKDQLPFRPHAQAGSLLDRAIRMAGFSRNQFLFLNTVWCFPGNSVVRAAGIEKLYRRAYAGDVINVQTRHAHFTCTPNHPVLTWRGWVAADSLNNGDQLIRCLAAKPLPTSDPYIGDIPIKFEELFSAFSENGVCHRIVDSNMNFHGDGRHGKVNIITVNGALRTSGESSSFKTLKHGVFETALQRAVALLKGQSTITHTKDDFTARLLAAAGRKVRGGGDLQSTDNTKFFHSELSGLTTATQVNAVFHELETEPRLAAVEFLSDIFKTFSIDVALDEVTKVSRYLFTGHVFNLQTRCGQYTVDDCIVSNCRPPGNKLDGESYEQAVIEHCAPHMDAMITRYKPRVLMPLGNVPLRALTQFDGKAKAQTISKVRGYAIPCTRYAVGRRLNGPHDSPMLCVPSYHPSFIKRGAQELLGVLIHDIKLAVWLARLDKLPTPPPTQYHLKASLDDALSFEHTVRAHPELVLSVDIETPWAHSQGEDDDIDEDAVANDIKTIQFSLARYRGIEMVWDGAYVDVAKRILQMPNRKLGANIWQFDQPRLAAKGALMGGRVDDLQWKFHALFPDIPKSLQYVVSLLGTRMRMIPQRDDFDESALGLQPWKHTAQETDGPYGCKDVDYPLRAEPLIDAELKRMNAWRAYEDHTLGIHQILVRASERGMPVHRARHAEFSAALRAKLRVKLDECQRIAPLELHTIKPANGYKNDKIALKLMSKPDQGLRNNAVERISGVAAHNDWKWERRRFDTGKNVIDDVVNESAKEIPRIIPVSDTARPDRFVERWCRVQLFLPDSPEQAALAIKYYGDPMPRVEDKKNGGQRDSTGKAGLEQLYRKKKRPLYKAILEYRALSEMKGHVEAWRPSDDASGAGLNPKNSETDRGTNSESEANREGYEEVNKSRGDGFRANISRVSDDGIGEGGDIAAHADGEECVGRVGRVHPLFTYTPATGQLACYGGLNALNPPKPKGQSDKDELAKLFRGFVVAKPGTRLREFDLKSAHSLTLGYEARSLEFIRYARADIHSYGAAHIIGQTDPGIRRQADECVNWSDADLTQFLSGIKKMSNDDTSKYRGVRDKSKVVILAWGFCETVKGMYSKNKDSFQNESEVVRIDTLMKELFPAIPRYHHAVWKEAHKLGRLGTQSGCVRHFWDIYHYDPRRADGPNGGLVLGDHARPAAAYRPANDAFCYMKDAMRRLDRDPQTGEEGWLDREGFILNFHDALLFEMPVEGEDEACARVIEELTRPSTVMKNEVAPDGLWIGCSSGVGANWNEVH